MLEGAGDVVGKEEPVTGVPAAACVVVDWLEERPIVMEQTVRKPLSS